MDTVISCPGCQGRSLEKYGKTPAGLQKYRCLAPTCRRQFVSDSEHRVDEATKDIVLKLLMQNVPPPKIKKAVPGISLRWIYELKLRMGQTATPGKIEYR